MANKRRCLRSESRQQQALGGPTVPKGYQDPFTLNHPNTRPFCVAPKSCTKQEVQYDLAGMKLPLPFKASSAAPRFQHQVLAEQAMRAKPVQAEDEDSRPFDLQMCVDILFGHFAIPLKPEVPDMPSLHTPLPPPPPPPPHSNSPAAPLVTATLSTATSLPPLPTTSFHPPSSTSSTSATPPSLPAQQIRIILKFRNPSRIVKPSQASSSSASPRCSLPTRRSTRVRTSTAGTRA